MVTKRNPRARHPAPKRRPPSSPRLRIAVIGGCEEIGRNMTMFEYGNDIFLIDMGLQFPESDMPGVDYIVPNIDYLRSKVKNIRGVIITHAHLDHIGGIPHLMGDLGNPTIYTARLSAEIIKKRQEEHKQAPKPKFFIFDENSKFRLGRFSIELFRVNHNIPDSFGIVVHTPVGTVVHTGDFKIDYSPMYDRPADLNRFAEIGTRGVLALLADSTNAPQPGHQISESEVNKELAKLFEQSKGRLIIGTFASHLNRVMQIIDLAEKYGRQVIIEGRSMKTNVEIAHKLKYLKIKQSTLISAEDYKYKKMPDDKVVILGSGAQGERNAFLTRFANEEHRHLFVKEGDTIVFSSSVIPGNERDIASLKDTLARKGATIIHYHMMDVHAGGHAKQEDLKLTMQLFKPKILIPIEASHHMLQTHASLGETVGIPRSNIFVPDNGQIMEFTKTSAKLTNETIPSDYVMVDGLGVGDVSNIVLRDRLHLSEDGMIVIIATIRHKTGQLVGNPDIISRGFVYLKENKKLIEDTRLKVKKICDSTDKKSSAFDDHIKNKVRDEIGQFLWAKTRRRPMILPVVIKV